MDKRLWIEILPQPDLTTCGPTCLHAVYRFFGEDQPLASVIERVTQFADGGTLAVMLAIDALKQGYGATIHTFNLHVFDPTWFAPGAQVDISERLELQRAAKSDDAKLQIATPAYQEFLRLGGKLVWGDLTGDVIHGYLDLGFPILTGLSSTYLYQEPRENPATEDSDDIAGVPCGHFVILSGFDARSQRVRVADPLEDNPLADEQHYSVHVDRVVCSILLGVLTYDANLLIVHPTLASKMTEAPAGGPT